MQVGRFWLISDYNGPWQIGYPSPDPGGKGGWWIINKDTGASVSIGPVRKSGRNFCDEARAEAKRRNRELGFENV